MANQTPVKPSKINGILWFLGWCLDAGLVIFMINRQFDPLMGFAEWKFPGIIHLVATVCFVIVHHWLRQTNWLRVWRPSSRTPFSIWRLVSILLIGSSGILAVSHDVPLRWDSEQALSAVILFLIGVVMLIRQR